MQGRNCRWAFVRFSPLILSTISTLVDSPNGFPPAVWGPHLWRVLHIISLNYPLQPTRDQQQAYYNLFKSLCVVIPCAKCRREFCKMVMTNTLKLERSLFTQRPSDAPGTARKRLAAYVVAMHSKVNERLGHTQKKTGREWVQYYARMRARHPKK